MQQIFVRLFVLNILLCSSILSVAQFEEFCLQYDTLSCIAGTGNFDDKGDNGWQASFEGKPATEAELSRPHFVMADMAGNIFIADKDAHGIRKISPEGIITTVAGTSEAGHNGDGIGYECQLSSPNGLWTMPNGEVYILDLGNNMIRKILLDGTLTTIVTDSDGISIGRGIWVSPEENIIYYASGSRIKRWTASEGISIYANGFSSLGNLIVNPMGELIVTDRGANKVYRIQPDGTKETIAGNGTGSGGGTGSKATETGIDGVRGIWYLDDGSYFLATHEGSQIWYVDTDGIIDLFLNGEKDDDAHSGNGDHFQTPGAKISEARSISIDYNGNILIAENDRGFIRKIRRNDYLSFIKETKSRQANMAFPNPFRESVQLKFFVTNYSHCELSITDINGRKMVSEHLNTCNDNIRFIWSPKNNIPNGIYIYSLKSKSEIQTGKIILQR